MIRKFRKIFRGHPATTTHKNDNTNKRISPDSTTHDVSYVNQESSSDSNQFHTGR